MLRTNCGDSSKFLKLLYFQGIIRLLIDVASWGLIVKFLFLCSFGGFARGVVVVLESNHVVGK